MAFIQEDETIKVLSIAPCYKLFETSLVTRGGADQRTIGTKDSSIFDILAFERRVLQLSEKMATLVGIIFKAQIG